MIKRIYSIAIPLFILTIAAHSQNIGIGQKLPISKLDVNGNLTIGSTYSGTAAPANGAIIQGNVGIGTTSPLGLLSVGSSSQFQVNSSGNLVSINGVSYSWPTTEPSAGSVLVSDGSGNMSWSTSAAGTSGWSLTGNSLTNSSTNFIGTIDSMDFIIKTNNKSRIHITASGSILYGSSSFDPSNPEDMLINAGTTSSSNVATFKGSINNYLQVGVQNNSIGTSASSDIVATADNGTDTSVFIDLGINGSHYTASNNFGNANDGYLYTYANNLLVGTQATGKSLIFMTGGGSTISNQRMIINGSGLVGIGTASPSSLLSVGSSSQFQINSSGDLISVKGVTYSWPTSNPGTGNSRVLQNDGSGNLSWTTPASGTITSVGLSMPSIFSVTNSPITSTGTITTTLANETANTIFAAPNGSTGTPVFRALVNADMPLSGITAGTYNNITVNAQGIATGGSNLSYVTSVSAVSPLASTGGTTPSISLAGAVPVANGGTGATTITSHGVVYGNGTSAVNATAAGTQGQILTVNSSGIPVFTTATYPATTTANQLLYSSAANIVTGLSVGTSGQVLTTNSSGALTWSSAGTGTVTSVTASAPLVSTGGVTPNITLSGVVPIANGGTNSATLSGSGIMVSNGTQIVVGSAGTTTMVLHGNASGAPSYSGVSLSADVINTLPVANGGTGTTSVTTNGLIYGNGTSAFGMTSAGSTGQLLYANSSGIPSWLGVGTNGQVLTLSGGSPAWTTFSAVTSVSVNAPLTSTGGLTPTISLGGIVPIANGGTNSATALSGSSIMISNGTQILQGSVGTTTTLLHGNASGAPTYSAANLTTDVTGTLPIANGGTGLTSYTTGSILDASSSSVVGQIADVTAGSYLRSAGSGSVPAWSTLTLPNAATTGDLLYASGTNAIGNLSDIATGNVLLSGGVGAAPSFGKVALGSAVSGTLTVANGGTGATTLTSNGVMYGNGTGSVGITAAPTPYQVLVGSISGPPTFISLSGDLTMNGSGALVITGLQGNSVSSTAPTTGQVLQWNGSAWTPTANGNGTVTSVTAGNGLTGGAITSSGTIALPYTEIVATLTQSGTSAPSDTVVYNNTGGTVTLAYVGVGEYSLTISGTSFHSANLTQAYITGGISSGIATSASVVYASKTVLNIYTSKSGTATNGCLTNSPIDIRIY